LNRDGMNDEYVTLQTADRKARALVRRAACSHQPMLQAIRLRKMLTNSIDRTCTTLLVSAGRVREQGRQRVIGGKHDPELLGVQGQNELGHVGNKRLAREGQLVT